MRPWDTEEAQRAQQRLTELRSAHAFYCDTCIHFKRCIGSPKLCRSLGHDSDMKPCRIAGVYDRAIKDAQMLIRNLRDGL